MDGAFDVIIMKISLYVNHTSKLDNKTKLYVTIIKHAKPNIDKF